MDQEPIPAHSALPVRARIRPRKARGEVYETLAVILIGCWFLALGIAYTLGGLIHILLLGSIVMALIHFTQNRRTS